MRRPRHHPGCWRCCEGARVEPSIGVDSAGAGEESAQIRVNQLHELVGFVALSVIQPVSMSGRHRLYAAEGAGRGCSGLEIGEPAQGA